MTQSTTVDIDAAQSNVASLLPGEKRARFERYWREYLSLPGHPSSDELRLQADIAAGVLLPVESALHPSTAVAVATGLLQYHRGLGEALADAFNALVGLRPGGPIRPPMNDYVVSALEELSYRLQSLARQLKEQSINN